MALIRALTGISGGSSVGWAEGTSNDTTSASETVTINTGLSSISKFVLTSDGRDNYFVYYCSSNSSNYVTYMMRGNSLYGSVGVVGGSAVAVQAWSIASINNGTVTLNAPSNEGHAQMSNITWFAE